MKKYISFFAMALALSFGFVSCDTETNEEPGGTNIEKMCGYWDVVYDAVDDAGNIVYEDPYGVGVCDLYTYNTNDNGVTQMYLDDRNTFWAYKFLVSIDYNGRTFSASETWYDAGESGHAIVTDGKILEGAAKNIHGMPTDSISFYIQFDDDSDGAQYGWTKWHVHGQRHSGFSPENE
ncbi:MAG: hypothetical protein II429_07740 [Prevotella sp.]|jgi:hypothetical protein|nr:hypothetical protein [Prevotella sp.]